MSLPARFWAKVRFGGDDSCWIWTGAKSGPGYGQIRIGSKKDRTMRTENAHRLAYLELVGSIPEGMVIDHLCRVRCCVNPGHMEPVPMRENTMRGDLPDVQRARHANRTHCVAGHERNEANTYSYITSHGYQGRGCRLCRIAQKRARRAADAQRRVA